MLHYDGTYVFEGIDCNKTSVSKDHFVFLID